MATALEISHRLAEQVILPLLRAHQPDLVNRIAIGMHGTGSDVLGLDDAISRDHHWEPRAVILLHDEDADRVDAVRKTLAKRCPEKFEGHPVRLDAAIRTGICVDPIGGYLRWFLGTDRMPERDEDWFGLCETDLLHMTSGEVFYDPSGVWTEVRRKLSYYPERVWKKRVADWCMYTTGRDSPYNLHRVSRRGDAVASAIYLGQALRRSMELGFAIERRYAPYPKWQYRLFATVEGCADQVAPMLRRLVDEAPLSWREKVDVLIQINWIYAQRLCALGLTSPPVAKPFDEGLTDLTLYRSAAEIYAQLPPAWLDVSFSTVESWEKLARLVLFDSGDYFERRYKR